MSTQEAESLIDVFASLAEAGHCPRTDAPIQAVGNQEIQIRQFKQLLGSSWDAIV
ncbi:MAG: hypothetical protein WD757_06860 [Actinomycetota bacterium]